MIVSAQRSVNDIDYYPLKGVPNIACTEAFAFLFQAKTNFLLGVEDSDTGANDANKLLSEFWATAEIAGVSLVELNAWTWLYNHPNATAAEYRSEVVKEAKCVWNKYFAPVYGEEDVILLAIYSHQILAPLYLSEFPIGFIINAQIWEQMNEVQAIGPEFERIAKCGKVTPDLWVENATGSTISPEQMLANVEEALKHMHQSSNVQQ